MSLYQVTLIFCIEGIQNMCICVKTAKGLKRRLNEDSYFIIDKKVKNDYDIVRRGKMFVIADGMGGQKGGGIASKMACEGIISAAANMFGFKARL